MNVQLSNTEEFIDNKSTGTLGQVLIRWVQMTEASLKELLGLLRAKLIRVCRCNNVLWISGDKVKKEDVKMSD